MLLAHAYSLNPSLKILPLIHPVPGTLVFFCYSENTPSCLYLRTFAHISPSAWNGILPDLPVPCSSLKSPLPHFIRFLLKCVLLRPFLLGSPKQNRTPPHPPGHSISSPNFMFLDNTFHCLKKSAICTC